MNWRVERLLKGIEASKDGLTNADIVSMFRGYNWSERKRIVAEALATGHIAKVEGHPVRFMSSRQGA